MSVATASGDTSVPLLDETIGANLARTVEQFGDKHALIVPFQDVRLSYDEFARECDRVARGLLALGLSPGERVGIWSPNNAEWVVTQFATAKAGLILVNINPAYRLAELEYALNKSGCVALITAARFKTSDYLGMLRDLMPEMRTASPGDIRSAK